MPIHQCRLRSRLLASWVPRYEPDFSYCNFRVVAITPSDSRAKDTGCTPCKTSVRQVPDLVLSVAIMRERGLVNFLRPGDSLRALRIALKAGPLVAMISHSAHSAPDAPAIVDAQGQLSYGELETQTNALARGFLDTGMSRHDVAGVLCRDHRGMVLAVITVAAKLGIRLVFLNTGLAASRS